MNCEVDQIVARYARRAGMEYDPITAAVYMAHQERQRAFLRWIRVCGIAPVKSKRVLEIGCGGGGNLLELLYFGFLPDNLCGNELLPERVQRARALLPIGVRILPGDARHIEIPNGSVDIVLQSTVFTSILDPEFQYDLAQRMWTWVIPGGGVLWYDFIFDNPRNPDVKGIPLRRVRELFPGGRVRSWRVTLAPPINRLVTRVHPCLYTIFNAIPALRTHVLCWIEKGNDEIC
jgi:SAM-dependent methyltransferase